jgi:hypothetical protein
VLNCEEIWVGGRVVGRVLKVLEGVTAWGCEEGGHFNSPVSFWGTFGVGLGDWSGVTKRLAMRESQRVAFRGKVFTELCSGVIRRYVLLCLKLRLGAS